MRLRPALAHELVGTGAFFEPCCSALTRRIAMGAELADGMTAYDGGERLAERTRARGDDYGNHLRWASPCFLE
jgi:hypothetical protein